MKNATEVLNRLKKGDMYLYKHTFELGGFIYKPIFEEPQNIEEFVKSKDYHKKYILALHLRYILKELEESENKISCAKIKTTQEGVVQITKIKISKKNQLNIKMVEV